MASGELLRNDAKREAKIKELEFAVARATKATRYFTLAADPKVSIKVFVILLPFLFSTIAFLFAVAFLAIERATPGSFAGPLPYGFLDLVLFSIANMFSANFLNIAPLTLTAKMLAISQVVCAVAIGVVLLLVITALSPERYREELAEAVADLRLAEQELSRWLEQLRTPGEG